MIKNFNINLIALLLLVSCVKDPSEPTSTERPEPSYSGVIIVCEGLWHMNNSTISRIADETNQAEQNLFDRANGYRIGDLANDAAQKGDTLFVAMTSAGLIRAIDMKTGKQIGKIILPEHAWPRRIALGKDSLGFVTDMYNHKVWQFNSELISFTGRYYECGPFPEGIAIAGDKLFVANSGYGDYYSHMDGAGTVSVISIETGQESMRLPNLPNAIEMIANDENLYVRYNHLPSMTDSIGGIAEFDIETLTETRRWHDDIFDITVMSEFIYYTTKRGCHRVNLAVNDSKPSLIIDNPDTTDVWYTLSVNPERMEIWIANAYNYQSMGSVSAFPMAGGATAIKNFRTGLNPKKIIFY